MTGPTITKPHPLAAIIVHGHVAGEKLPQAAWFRTEDMAAARTAAQTLKLAVLELRDDEGKALAYAVHEGVLKGTGRMVVGSIQPDVYRRIEDYARKASAADPSPKPATLETAATKPAQEQNVNVGSAEAVAGAGAKPEPIAPPPNPWEALRVGARVLAAYWNDKREFEGFWLATVKRVDKGEFTLEWFEAPQYPTFKSPEKNIAVLHPEFRVTGK